MNDIAINKMEPVTTIELAYELWKWHKCYFEQLYGHLTVSDAGVKLTELPVNKFLNELGSIDPTGRIYFEMLGWLTNENKRRKEYHDFQKKLWKGL